MNDTADPPKSWSPRTAILVLAASQLLVLSSVWPRFYSPNEYSRVFAAHAFVARGTFQIDWELARYGFIDDVSVFAGRHYSNKAPGLIFAAVPVIAALRAVAPSAPIGAELFAARAVLVSGAALACALLLATWIEREGNGTIGPAGAAFVLLFASGFAVYAGTFFSHAWTGALLFIAAYAVLGPGRHRGGWTDAAAGFCIALAAISEYPAAVVGIPLVLAAGWGRWRRMARMTAGGLLPLAALAAYNAACFGSPLTLSSRLEALPRYHELAAQTFFGFTVPHPAALAGLLFSPIVGLFFFFPVLLPALAAPVVAWRAGRKRLGVAVAGAVWLLPVVMAGYREWQGGASFGPRYLVLAIPFFVLGLAMLPPGRARWWVIGAAVPSAVAAFLGRATPPFAIDGAWTASTLRGWAIPALRSGLWNHPPG
ncbi:MAG: hypothetical protein GXP48_03355, partial [Acidobacteria bacterium]|nr:hypothetical protein [Acidobacteriota bacterium]